MSGVWRPCSRRTNERKWLSEADWQQYSGARAQLRGYFRLSCEFQNFCRWKWLMCAVTDKRLQTTKISSVLVVKLYSSARLLVFTLFRVPSWWNLVDVWSSATPAPILHYYYRHWKQWQIGRAGRVSVHRPRLTEILCCCLYVFRRYTLLTPG